jgi:hypothetical protein
MATTIIETGGEDRLVILSEREYARLLEADAQLGVRARTIPDQREAGSPSGAVHLSRDAYERLVAAADMLEDIRLADEARARRESGEAAWLDGELALAAAEGLGAVRVLRGLSIGQLALEAGLTAEMVDSIERGLTLPDAGQRGALAKALDAPEAILFA